jgi:hypothetical protein
MDNAVTLVYDGFLHVTITSSHHITNNIRAVL